VLSVFSFKDVAAIVVLHQNDLMQGNCCKEYRTWKNH